MDTFWDRFLFAMLAGLATAFTLEIVIKSFWQRVARPFLEELAYKDSRIEGRWEATATLDDRRVERVWEMSQRAHQVEAMITSTGGFDKGRTFKMKGTFKNMILTGVYNPTDTSRADRGTYTFKLTKDGQCLEGHIAHYSTETERVAADRYILRRSTAERCEAGDAVAAHDTGLKRTPDGAA